MMDNKSIKNNPEPDFLLEQVEWQDLESVFDSIQQSFNISFSEDELARIRSFGDLCDLVYSKIDLDYLDESTTDNGYTKLMAALSITCQFDGLFLSAEMLLEDVIPRRGRIKMLKNLQNILDMELLILTVPRWISFTLLITCLLSLIGFFFNAMVASIGIVLSYFGFLISGKFGKEINTKTIGQLVDHMVCYNYLKSRNDPNTVNDKEVDDVIRKLFIYELSLEPSVLYREAKINKF